MREHGDAQEHCDGKHGHPDEGRRGVLRLGRTERGHTVRDGSTPVIAVQPLANAVIQQKYRQPRRAGVGGRRQGQRHDRAARVAVKADREQHEDADDEEVRGDGKDAAGLPDAAEVAQHEDGQKAEAQFHAVRRQRRLSRGEGEHAG